MPLKNQPYLPLYVSDFMTDEKLIECSPQATGLFIRIMCIMHKSNEYGKILLKQNDKQNLGKVQNFACKLARYLPWDAQTILPALQELLDIGLLILEGDNLIQKRMVSDNYLSEIRSKAGSKGGKKTMSKPGFAQAKSQANTENEIAIEIAIENENKDENLGNASAEFSDEALEQKPAAAKKTKPQPKPTASSPHSSFIDDIILLFQQTYAQVRGSPYTVVHRGKERKAASQLLQLFRKRFPQSNSDEILAGLKAYFQSTCAITDDWLHRNMSLSIMTSKFNEINQTLLKNGKSSQQSDLSRKFERADSIIDQMYKPS